MSASTIEQAITRTAEELVSDVVTGVKAHPDYQALIGHLVATVLRTLASAA